MSTNESFEAAVRQHDARVAAAGLVIWVGSEPTFTDRADQSPQWLHQALGGDKEQRARAVLQRLGRLCPGSLVLRSVGRLYPGEDEPRWCLGLYRRRDGLPIWQGPQDPILALPGETALPGLRHWADVLASALVERGFSVEEPSADEVAPTGARLQLRASLAGGSPPDPPAAGDLTFGLGFSDADGPSAPRIELPKFASLSDFLAALEAIQGSSLACRLPALIVAGSAPPVDASVELTTLTPDPAVVEVNTAPSADATAFLHRSREIYLAAADEGLAPYRLYFNGAVADSGGGGQITLGGPSPRASPFLLDPRLLPRLVGFFNRHPALSYLYSHDHVGSSGQSARADERGTDALDELGLALGLLQQQSALTPQLLWQSLAPFLCDASGNSHRAEINIEKLWNPGLAERGMLGLVEFRALRMQHTPERATALACLLRALVAMLSLAPQAPTLVDWGRALHDRFALPFYLEQDLQGVLEELDAAGLGLGEVIEAVLMQDECRLMGQVALPGCTLELRRALEFWPLLGDSSSPEQGGTARLVDASTARVELRLRPAAPGNRHWRDWQVLAEGVALPMRHERDAAGELGVFGLRYRSFVPNRGLHPVLNAQTPLRLLLRHPDDASDHRVTLHEWQPAGEAYAGLPQDLAEAARRRAERLTVEVLPHDPGLALRPAPAHGLSPFSLDLRCLPAAGLAG